MTCYPIWLPHGAPPFILPGYPQHVIIWGNNSEPVFTADEDYHFFLDKHGIFHATGLAVRQINRER